MQAVGLLTVVLLPLWVWALFFSWNYDYSAGLVLVPAFFLSNLLLTLPASRGEPFLRRLLPVALMAKLAAASIYLWMDYHVYGLAVDTVMYWSHGAQIAHDLVNGGHWVTLQPFWSTNFIYMLTGLLFSVTTDSLPTAVVVYSLIAFWGQYLFYRAFINAFPQGNRKLAAVLIFLLPSIVFWTSTIGKDALICFFLGLSAYAFTRLHRRVDPLGFILLLLALAGTLAIRPHIALMLGTGFVMPYLFGKNRQGIAGVLGRIVGVPLLLAGSIFMATQAKSFLNMEDFSQGQAAQALAKVGSANAQGGSAFGSGQSVAVRALNAPFVLFRPWPWEVHNLQSGISSLEGLFLLAIFVRRRRDLYEAIRNWRNPFVFFVLLFGTQFALIFSAAITNFGLLSRERVMLLPFAMMLFCTRGEPELAGRRADAPGPLPWALRPDPRVLAGSRMK